VGGGEEDADKKNHTMTAEVTFTLKRVLNKTNRAGCPNRFIHERNLADGEGGSTVGIGNFNL